MRTTSKCCSNLVDGNLDHLKGPMVPMTALPSASRIIGFFGSSTIFRRMRKVTVGDFLMKRMVMISSVLDDITCQQFLHTIFHLSLFFSLFLSLFISLSLFLSPCFSPVSITLSFYLALIAFCYSLFFLVFLSPFPILNHLQSLSFTHAFFLSPSSSFLSFFPLSHSPNIFPLFPLKH